MGVLDGMAALKRTDGAWARPVQGVPLKEVSTERYKGSGCVRVRMVDGPEFDARETARLLRVRGKCRAFIDSAGEAAGTRGSKRKAEGGHLNTGHWREQWGSPAHRGKRFEQVSRIQAAKAYATGEWTVPSRSWVTV